MTATCRLAAALERATRAHEAMLVLYATLGDPLTGEPADLLAAAMEAGADVLELGLPTPGAQPRGAEIRASFERAQAGPERDVWAMCRDVRLRAPDAAVVCLIYPETIRDLGLAGLIAGARGAGVDGLVMVAPEPEALAEVASAGLAAIPVITAGDGEARTAELESLATPLTYRTIAGRTGDPVDLEAARRTVVALAASTRKPFWVGFGIQSEAHIRALAPHAAGVVIGSELLRTLRGQPVDQRAAAVRRAVTAWKAAARAREPSV